MTSGVAIKAGDILGDVYELKFGEYAIVAERSAQRVDLREPRTSEPFGSIRLGTPRAETGSIWIGRECIGEFELVNGDFVITPISNGRLDVDIKLRIHPLDYLLKQAVKLGKLAA